MKFMKPCNAGEAWGVASTRARTQSFVSRGMTNAFYLAGEKFLESFMYPCGRVGGKAP